MLFLNFIWKKLKYSVSDDIISTFINCLFFQLQDTFYCRIKKYSCFLQMDRVYLSSPNRIAVLDHERKRTYLIRKEGLPDTGKYLQFNMDGDNVLIWKFPLMFAVTLSAVFLP